MYLFPITTQQHLVVVCLFDDESSAPLFRCVPPCSTQRERARPHHRETRSTVVVTSLFQFHRLSIILQLGNCVWLSLFATGTKALKENKGTDITESLS